MAKTHLTKSPIAARFHPKVNRSGGPLSCWPWTAWCRNDGYGSIRDENGVEVLAHRFAWTEARGAIPAGLCVLHHCDNRPCCNPAHLFLGTRADNIRDMDRKGRGRRAHRGSANGRAKLTESHVVAIRKRYAQGGVTQKDLARCYGVSPALINFICTRRKWRHI